MKDFIKVCIGVAAITLLLTFAGLFGYLIYCVGFKIIEYFTGLLIISYVLICATLFCHSIGDFLYKEFTEKK